jgi:menaquinone-dependent protoporphyrinogen oxidase
MNARILIVYGSSYGQTEKIARRLAELLTARACDVTVADAKALPSSLRADAFDGVVVGASIIARGHQPAVRDFVHANLSTLNRLPSAFYSVCASAGSAHEKSRAAARSLRDAFLAEMGWHPALSESIAGAINFTRYNFILRWYMKKASKMNGGSTDTSRDHEYTDWAQVERFAGQIADAVARWTPLTTPPHVTATV